MDDRPLLQREPAWNSVDPGLPLVIALSGYRDAGLVVPQVQAALADSPEAPVVARVDLDRVFDYRARRPIVHLDGATLGAVDLPTTELLLLHDQAGSPYLMLTGFEPDFQWQRLADELLEALEVLDVASTTWVHSFAMPVPHTRMTRLSASGNRPDLVEQLSVWSPEVAAPAHFAHLLGARLLERDHPVLGLVALTPHYVGDAAVPAGAIAILEGIATVTGLLLETSDLREADREFRLALDTQFADNDEASTLIQTLESQHDAYLDGLPQRSTLRPDGDTLPSADDLASELESFLRRQRDEGTSTF